MSVGTGVGAAVFFVGLARDNITGEKVQYLELEHYEGMTQKYMQEIVQRAAQRWKILGARIVHRVGRIYHGEQIVFVGAVSIHRAEAFTACEFIVDHMKTDAPLWKAEHNGQRHCWVPKNKLDTERREKWNQR